ncbi:hypothetical protein CXZ10_01545 [Pleomorphomonas diazotrophica]|uniref:DUF2946 domain-containing protein n=1 Tax=Pleomorphomonas diazotrophica TaxID=1166257 RepID=A0A1I4VGM0_9HYPH|nr:hypothetical protein [Pleomorphomonas diazotrophica]PKR90101.1 hypothetical protein CXZ10_01545 [Pleomorphomonas diazotrophica]SFN00318.1 hypothetical protein SAMN05192571_111122 [Pleomorphomonas diazotrophica]
MRFLAALRLVLVAAALIGLLAGRSIVLPVAAAHAEMAMTADSEHDCCDKDRGVTADKASLGNKCFGLGCPMIAPALLPASPALAQTAELFAAPSGIMGELEGRSPRPLLEPPRA